VVTAGIVNFFAFEATAPFGALGALPEPSRTAVAFSCGHVTVTLTWLSDFCVAFPVSSQLGGLSGCQVGSKSKTGGELEVSG